MFGAAKLGDLPAAARAAAVHGGGAAAPDSARSHSRYCTAWLMQTDPSRPWKWLQGQVPTVLAGPG